MKSTLTGAACLAAALACAGACAQSAPPAPEPATDSVTIRGHYDNAVGTSDAASQGTINRELLKSRPALRPGEVLEFVPGLIVTQHSGDGKANQYFLRGFNLDHGTDFATRVNGMPVNMPTHGHGQGYTDLNFLIPELVQRVDYRKGPYFASNGDFASAGSADIAYLRQFDAPFAQITAGSGHFRRGVAGGSYALQPGESSGLRILGAVEMQRTDGPWAVPEGLKKDNAVFTLSGGTAENGFSTSLMAYRARWTATDQVPQRLIDAGVYNGAPFDRFSSLDRTTGGDTARNSLSAEWHANGAQGRSHVSAYAIQYRLDLNSNFTYALERPADGDQFKQRDQRHISGLDASHSVGHTLGGLDARSEVGLSLRQDRVRVGLYDSVARRVTATVREDEVRETLGGVYAQTAVDLTGKLRAIVGARADHVDNRVDALTLAAGGGNNGGRSNATLVSPKLSLIARPFTGMLDKTELFFNAGRGFHSNDARGTTTTREPLTGNAVDKVPPLVASRGYELGARTEAIRGLQTSIALWKLDFNSELVYVGDAGVTEASGASTRRGVEINNRWVPVSWFLLDADLAWTHGRFRNGDRIPNAVDHVASVALTLRELRGWSASLQWRYLGSGALVEDNSERARSSLTTNLRMAYQFNPHAELTLDVFNLFNRQVNDIQYLYDSQLPGETAPVTDRHVHPAEPRSARLTLQLRF
jgi:outer membrane receptor protein involved in Fe transport